MKRSARIGPVCRFALILAIALLPATALTPQLCAQTYTSGAVEGAVTDPSGAAIAGATITARNTATGVAFTTKSSTDGLYGLPVLPVGIYDLTLEQKGFAKVESKGVIVTVGSRITLNIQMPLAAQQASVTVTGEVPLVEASRSAITSTVNDLSVANLPVQNRNFISFVLLTPGVTTDVRLGDISFAGQRGTLNSLVVDGSDNNNTFFGQTLGRTGSGRAPYQFSQDAVKEFQVNSNAYSAEYGNAGGAVVNVVTKSGTNQFHGAGFWFYRDHALNANDLINKNRGAAKSPYHFNQFGGDVGGPMVRDKAFFFFDYDGQRNILPNLVALGGTLPATPTLNQQTAINYLESRAASWITGQDQDVYLGKVDWRITRNELLTGRINSQRFTGANLENGGLRNALEHTGGSLVNTDTVAVGLTSTLTPHVVNEARFTYVRDDEPGEANSINPEANVFNGGQLILTVGRNFFSPRFTNIHRGQWSDTLAYLRGRHSWKFGGQIMTDRIKNFFPGNFSGAFTFRCLENFGRSRNGQPLIVSTDPTLDCPALSATAPTVPADQFVQAFAGPGTNGPTTHPNLTEYSLFAQDEWRLRNNLTLNLGLRYDYDAEARPPITNPAASLAAAGINTGRINSDTNNFGPRIGVAWAPLANQKLVLRGGYGIFYGRTPSILLGTAHSNNGLNVVTFTFTGSGIPNYPNTICGAPAVAPNCPPPTSGGSTSPPIIFVFGPDYVQPYVQQWSLSGEYQLGRDMAFSLTYLGVRGVHLQRTVDVNLQGPETPTAIGIAGTTQALTFNRITLPRPIAGFSRIDEFQSSANSIFHGLTLQFTKRFSQHYQMLASYTFGKVIDDVPDATSVVPFTFDDAKQIEDPLNVRADRAAGNNDQRHRFVLSGVWDLSRYADGLPAAGRAILGGWELSGILTAQSGQPYSGLVNFDLNGDGNSRTDRTPGLPRNTFTLPSTVSLDPRVTRNVKLTERTRLQFIAEAFNVFNRANIAGLNQTQFSRSTSTTVCGVAGTPCLVPQRAFQSPTSTLGPRIGQLAIKFVF